MAWCWSGDKPLLEPVIVWFIDAYMHHWASIPDWINSYHSRLLSKGLAYLSIYIFIIPHMAYINTPENTWLWVEINQALYFYGVTMRATWNLHESQSTLSLSVISAICCRVGLHSMQADIVTMERPLPMKRPVPAVENKYKTNIDYSSESTMHGDSITLISPSSITLSVSINDVEKNNYENSSTGGLSVDIKRQTQITNFLWPVMWKYAYFHSNSTDPIRSQFVHDMSKFMTWLNHYVSLKSKRSFYKI